MDVTGSNPVSGSRIWFCNSVGSECLLYKEEVVGRGGNPFKIVDGVESWVICVEQMDRKYSPENNSNDVIREKWRKNSIKIRETMTLLSPEAKKSITSYYEKNK